MGGGILWVLKHPSILPPPLPSQHTGFKGHMAEELDLAPKDILSRHTLDFKITDCRGKKSIPSASDTCLSRSQQLSEHGVIEGGMVKF